MSFGIDYVTGPPIADLLAHVPPVAFVCRYLSEVNPATQVKLLTPVEAKAFGAAGISVVSNYEWTGTTALGGYNAGVFDAQIARDQHAACGGPADSPIYFSVDFGATSAQMGTIGDYFKGVASIIGLARTGVYGSYAVVKYLLDNDLVTWAWQTYAWSGGAWDSRADIQQYQNGVDLDGHEVDYDRSMKSDFGQWIYGGSMVPTGWHDDGHTLTAPNGKTVVLGFREHVLSSVWDANNVPLEEEHGQNPLEEFYQQADNTGSQQVFLYTVLNYNQARGVYVMGVGNEFLGQRAEIATLKAAPPTPTPVDTSTVVADVHAIIDALPPMFAKLLVDVGNL